MGWLFDILWLSWTVVGGWLLMRRGPWLAIVRVVSITAGYTVALSSALLLLRALACHGSPALTLLLAPPLVAIAGFLLGAWGGRRLCGVAAGMMARPPAGTPLRGGRVVLVLIGTLWSATQLLAYLLLVNLAVAAWPTLGETLHEHSLLARHLLSPNTTLTEGVVGQDQVHGDASSIDALLQDTGVRSLMTYFRVLHLLIAMDQAHRMRVLTDFPAIAAAASSPALTAVLSDDRLLALITRACHGSLPAVIQLAHDPRMERLSQDPLMRAAAKQFDVRHMQEVLEQPASEDLPLQWELATMTRSLDLARQLGTANGWSTSDPGAVLAWREGTRYGLARTHVPTHPLAQQLRLLSAGTCACWVDGRRTPPHRADGFAVVDLPAGPARDLVLMIYFASDTSPHRCLAALVVP